jgi:hypothetical protein
MPCLFPKLYKVELRPIRHPWSNLFPGSRAGNPEESWCSECGLVSEGARSRFLHCHRGQREWSTGCLKPPCVCWQENRRNANQG